MEGPARSIGVAVNIATPAAVVVDAAGHAFVLDKTSCVGASKTGVKSITSAGVVLRDGTRLTFAEDGSAP